MKRNYWLQQNGSQLFSVHAGFKYWKEATTFQKHQASDCHREANEAIIVLPKSGDIGELLNRAYREEKVVNREMFLRILQNIRFLSRQGLGGGDCTPSEHGLP